jgi:DNA-binding CsgD family transcriptional regulator
MMIDELYRADMERSSKMLRDAILAARAGTHPATPPWPLRLPPEHIERPPRPRAASRQPAPAEETPEEIALKLFAKGYTYTRIAKELGLPRAQAAQGLLRRIKHRSPGRYWRAHQQHLAARGVIT